MEVRKIIEDRVKEKQRISNAKGHLSVFLLLVSALMFVFMAFLGRFKGLFPSEYSVLFYSTLVPAFVIVGLGLLSFREIATDRLKSLIHIQYLQGMLILILVILQGLNLYLFLKTGHLNNILIPIMIFHVFHLVLAGYYSLKITGSLKKIIVHSRNPLEAYRIFVFQFYVALVWSLIVFYA